MTRRFAEAVFRDFPSRVAPQAMRSTLGQLRPTAGNLAPSESWRRMLGGRKRYNHERQQSARARREAILIWLLEYRQQLWSELLGEWLHVGRIIVQHGDGAMLARALGVGAATVCRDLSALQAVYAQLFGSRRVAVGYAEYMAGWRHGRRVGMGTEQPDHNLRYPQNQRRPRIAPPREAASMAAADCGTSAAVSASQELSTQCGGSGLSESGRPMTVEGYLVRLEAFGLDPRRSQRRRRSTVSGRPA